MDLDILASEQYYASRLGLTNAVQEEKTEVQRYQMEERFEDAETGKEEHALTYELLWMK